MIYKILHKLFGWDYIHYYSCELGIYRIRKDTEGTLYFYTQYGRITVINEKYIALWLTCPRSKYFSDTEPRHKGEIG